MDIRFFLELEPPRNRGSSSGSDSYKWEPSMTDFNFHFLGTVTRRVTAGTGSEILKFKNT